MNIDKESNEFYNDAVKCDINKIVKNLLCYLCGGIYRNPHTFNECTDTFCKSCIYKYFLKNKKKDECPKCLTKIGGRPFDSLIFDNTLNTLINIIFPEFEKCEYKLSKIIENLFIDEIVLDETTFEGKEKLSENYNEYLLIRIEPDETFENIQCILIPEIQIPIQLNTNLLKKFIAKILKEICKDENDIVLFFDNCIIDEDNLSFEDLIKLYGLGRDEITIIKFSIKECLPNY